MPTAKKLGRATERPHGNSEGKDNVDQNVEQLHADINQNLIMKVGNAGIPEMHDIPTTRDVSALTMVSGKKSYHWFTPPRDVSKKTKPAERQEQSDS